MPTVHVISLRPPAPDAVPTLLAMVRDELSRAIGCPPRQVWVYWTEGAALTGESEGWEGHCPHVLVYAKTRDELQVRRGLDATARAVATALMLPIEDVWVAWREIAPGRVFTGGAVH